MVGAPVYLDVVSVVQQHKLAVKAEGVTTIENAAKEPHIVDLANFCYGADIKGAGTDVIKIKGKRELKGGHTIQLFLIRLKLNIYDCSCSRGCAD